MKLKISPDKPTKPTGPLEGKPNMIYEYLTSTTDNEDDQLYYLFSLG